MSVRREGSIGLRSHHENRILHFWKCPKCGEVNWQDVNIVKEDDKQRLKHKCGKYLKPRLVIYGSRIR